MTRHHRLCFVIAASLVLGPATTTAFAQQLVYLVRHAERADQGVPAGQMLAPADPPLSAAGEARARRLATMLGDAGIAAIFATEFRRTRDTAQPLAERLGVDVQIAPGSETDALVARLRTEHARDVVLVVGHSNTIPAVITALGGPSVTIAENDYDTLFVFVPATGTLSRIRF